MDNMKLSGIMLIAAGVFFILSGFLSGSIVYLPLGVVLIILGLRKMRQSGGEE